MLLRIGLVVSGCTVPAGIGAFVMSLSNLVIWAYITSLVGSIFAIVGLALIYLALVLANRRAEREFSDNRIQASNEVLSNY